MADIGGLLKWKPNPKDLRKDGSRKSTGWLGVLKRPDGKVSTEISVGINLDGQEVEIPTLVPTLAPEEINWLLTNDVSNARAIPQSIMQKAADHARSQIKRGLSPFK